MLELVRGYAAAVLDEAQEAGTLTGVVGAVGSLGALVVASDRLRFVLTDSSIPGVARAAVLADLLEGKVPSGTVALVTFPVLYERATELPKTFEQLLEVGEERSRRAEAGAHVDTEPPIGRSGALERLRGFAERVFETIEDQTEVDGVEDELFRFARISEHNPTLRAALADPLAPLAERMAVVDSLLAGKVRAETIRLAGYVLRCGRARDIVGGLDYLVELAAAERGRRVAHVRAAVELSEDERQRLAGALGTRMRRPVELRVVVEPALLGGIGVMVGDTIIDGTLRHRLEELRGALLVPAG